MTRKHLALAGALLLAFPAYATPHVGLPSSQASAGGTIEGVVELPEATPRRTMSRYGGGGAARPIQSIPPVVYLEGRIGPAPEPVGQLTMAQQDTSFVPPLLVVPVGTRVAFPNQDRFFHNVFSYSRAGRFDLGRYSRGESKDVVFDEPGVVKVYCEVHESMRAAVVVVENRYWAEPAEDGTFRIEDVPAGTYTLVAWHADGDEAKREVVVTEGGVTKVELSL